MRTAFSKCVVAVTLLGVLAVPLALVAQNGKVQHQYHHYQLIDLGTFGGPTSYFSNGFDGILNNQGVAIGWSDTSSADSFEPFCFNPDCFVSHGFKWQDGVLTDLGALAGGASSQAFWISSNGLIVGNSENGQIDPLFTGWPEFRAVLWQGGQIIDLGTLEGGYESFIGAVNNKGQAVGLAMNTVLDPFNINGPGFFPTQSRAFLWQSGTMQDLGTLGGNDAQAMFINEAGQVAGNSYTSTTPNSTTGVPTIDPFVWVNGAMHDLGTLGGTIGSPSAMNNHGQVVGTSNLSGDSVTHPFLWTKHSGMQDLGTLGGNNGVSNWINDAGDIVGKADLAGPAPQTHDAVLWRHSGKSMIDLGVLPGDSCANAYYVNNRGQVVGTSENMGLCLVPTGEHAFLWESGGPMVDLNTLIPSGASLALTFAFSINDRGEIIGVGVPSGCTPDNIDFCGHAFVLMPCDEDHPGVDGCDYSTVDAAHLERQIGRLQNSKPDAPSVLPSRNPLSRFPRAVGFSR